MKLIYNLHLLLFLLLIATISLNAKVNYSPTVKNGGILLIEAQAKKLTYNNKTHSPIQKNTFLIPVNYRAKIGKHYFIADNKKYFFQVKRGTYKKDVLKVSKNKTSFNKKIKERTIEEAILVKRLYKKDSESQYTEPFLYPLQSKLTSFYGNARIFNNQIKSYHSGIDFRAKVGTKIKASNSGIVVLAKDLFYCGKCVIVSHGNKIFSIYAHLSEFLVHKGQSVKRGQIIALSGKTGRVTGPHLHFGMVLEGIKVDPVVGIEILNGLM